MVEINIDGMPRPILWKGANDPETLHAVATIAGHAYQDGLLSQQIPHILRVANANEKSMLDMLERIVEAEFGYGGWPEESEIRALIAKVRTP